jgi:hypothetical protein
LRTGASAKVSCPAATLTGTRWIHKRCATPSILGVAIGPTFAKLAHEHLHVETLEALKAAAHSCQLDTVPGIGERRSKIIRQALASILGRRPRLSHRKAMLPPPVDVISSKIKAPSSPKPAARSGVDAWCEAAKRKEVAPGLSPPPIRERASGNRTTRPNSAYRRSR